MAEASEAPPLAGERPRPPQRARRPSHLQSAPSSPRLVFVGTGGGAHPRRRHAAIAVQPQAERVLLLDTGGGFETVAGLQRAGIDLCRVTHIFLSHRHSDHLFGLEPLLLHIGLQAMWTGQPAPVVHVFGAPLVLAAAQGILEAVVSHGPKFIADAGGDVLWQPIAPGGEVPLWPGATLTPISVDHVPEDGTNLGCAVDLPDPSGHGVPLRLVYSGDTRPAPALRDAARGAQVLIHEVGGLDAQRELVMRAGHTTAANAAREAHIACVARLFLFHVPNDDVVPDLLAEAQRHFTGSVDVPDDGDAVPLAVGPQRAVGSLSAKGRSPRRKTSLSTAGAGSPPAPSPAG